MNRIFWLIVWLAFAFAGTMAWSADFEKKCGQVNGAIYEIGPLYGPLLGILSLFGIDPDCSAKK